MKLKELPNGTTGFRLKRDSMHTCHKINNTTVIFVGYVGPESLRETFSKVGTVVSDLRPDEEVMMVATA